MPNLETLLTSGAKLQVTVAPFEDALSLTDAILKAMKGTAISPEILEADIQNPVDMLRGNSALFSVLLDRAISVMTSPDVKVSLFKCMERATYENRRLDKGLFDDPKLGEQAREDFITIARKVIEVNCTPFFKQTFSGLKTQFLIKPDIPKSS